MAVKGQGSAMQETRPLRNSLSVPASPRHGMSCLLGTSNVFTPLPMSTVEGVLTVYRTEILPTWTVRAPAVTGLPGSSVIRAR